MKKTIKELEKVLGFNFKKKDLLKHSLVHKSFNSNHNNEKLEFLGDRVLGLIISKKLLTDYPNEKEGIIDKKFANLVNKKTCQEVAKKLDIRSFMFVSNSYKFLNRSSEKITSDCLEAVIGAIYLDSGIKAAEKIVLKLWKKFLDDSVLPVVDAKTRLQEYSLKKYKQLPKYTFYKSSGPQHNPTFKTDVQIPNSKKTIGTGSSKKNAQQNAAEKLLRLLE